MTRAEKHKEQFPKKLVVIMPVLKMSKKELKQSGKIVKDNGFTDLECGPIQYVVDSIGLQTVLFNQKRTNINIWFKITSEICITN